MKQSDIDKFKAEKAEYVEQLKQKQYELHALHSAFNRLVKNFKCDHINGDGSISFKKIDLYHLRCELCNKTEYRNPHPKIKCNNINCDGDGFLRDGPWGNYVPCPDCNGELSDAFNNQEDL
jgi:hypothetical protein